MEKINSKILAQGAEAVIRLEDKFIIKDRIKKSYRFSQLDEKIRKLRTRSEIKLLTKASKVINAPLPLESKEDNKIVIPYVKGKKLSTFLDTFSLKQQKAIAKQLGEEISKLHKAEIIHGDLTTSNMILVDNFDKNVNNKYRDKNPLTKNSVLTINNKSSERNEPILGRGGGDKFSIFFIDFGLGFISNKLEDKAVDLHLLKQALEARHFKHWEALWQQIEQGYKTSKESKKVLERLRAVEKRGRYKEKY